MKDIEWLLIVAVCALAALGVCLYQMDVAIKEGVGIEEDCMPEYNALPDDVLITGEFKASDFAFNQSHLDELECNRSIWIADGFDDLSIRLPGHPKGNITVYQGDRIVFFFCAS